MVMNGKMQKNKIKVFPIIGHLLSVPLLSFAPIIIKQERYAIRQRPTILGGMQE